MRRNTPTNQGAKHKETTNLTTGGKYLFDMGKTAGKVRVRRLKHSTTAKGHVR